MSRIQKKEGGTKKTYNALIALGSKTVPQFCGFEENQEIKAEVVFQKLLLMAREEEAIFELEKVYTQWTLKKITLGD